MIKSEEDLVELLQNSPKDTEEESNDHARILTAIGNANGDIFENTTLPGHVTASGIICNKELDHMLLIHHKKLDIWIQPGGHSDGNHDTLDETYREVVEETGISRDQLELVQQEPIDIDIHDLPADTKRGIGEHNHLDVRYLFTVDKDSVIFNMQEDEVHAIKWFSFDEILKDQSDSRLERVVNKINSLKTYLLR